MVRRTTLNLDAELVSEARSVLKTTNMTDTVHGALREVVRRDRLRRLAEWDLGGRTLDDLHDMRRPRIETKEWGKFAREAGALEVSRSAKRSRKATSSAEQPQSLSTDAAAG
jgi:Arc/MetJ family transcription regulator